MIKRVPVCVFFGVLLLAGVSFAGSAGPKIVLPEGVYDFGTVEQGADVTHEFKFRNSGDADLIITDVKTSCGCTAAVTSAKTIAPGGEGTLKVIFNSRGRRGRQNKTITIFSNDPERPRASVRLTGILTAGKEPQIVVTPPIVDLGVMEPGEKKIQKITIANMGNADLVIEDYIGRNNVSVQQWNSGKSKATIKPMKSLSVDVEVVPKRRDGIFQGYLQIRNNTFRRIVTVPVYGYISDRYMLKPEYRK